VIRTTLALLALGLAALVLQGTLAALLPPAFVPDLGLLVALTAAVSAPALPALILAAGVGFGADLLSGTLLGEQALLRLLAFAATRFVSGQFHLERGLPLATFCLAVGVLDALGLAGLSRLFAGSSPFGWEALPTLAVRAALGALLVPWVHGLVGGISESLSEGDAPRRAEVRFDTRRPVL
jgi:rod shape-determining protein MreD